MLLEFSEVRSSTACGLQVAGSTRTGLRLFAAFAIGVVLLALPAGARAQLAERVLHDFCSSSNCSDGENPETNLIIDSRGNLYGATLLGGTISSPECPTGCGVAFEFTPPNNTSSNWTESILHSFCSRPNCADGVSPFPGMIFDSKGNLYGNAAVTFELSPPGGSGPWTENVLYTQPYGTGRRQLGA